jgi:hypothetical protein
MSPRDFGKNGTRDSWERRGNGGREPTAEADVARLDGIYDQSPRCSIKGIGEADRVGDAESVRARRRGMQRHRFGAVDTPWYGRLAQDSVDDDGEISAIPGIEQLGGFPVGDRERDAARDVLAQVLDYGGTDAVVAAEFVPDADYDPPGRIAAAGAFARALIAHLLSTVRSRKCVEQEMHGS